MIAILDYGVGNVGSIKNMLKKVGHRSAIVSEASQIQEADKFILPGVGSFDNGISRLKASSFFEPFEKAVLEEKKPVLGICIGFQLLFERSEEGKLSGLGWVTGDIVRFDASRLDSKLKVPHMGWSNVKNEKGSNLLEGLQQDPRFYFVHSYHPDQNAVSNPLLTCQYGYEFTCGIEQAHIMGVQFHPEKSHKYGMKLLSNFATNY